MIRIVALNRKGYFMIRVYEDKRQIASFPCATFERSKKDSKIYNFKDSNGTHFIYVVADDFTVRTELN